MSRIRIAKELSSSLVNKVLSEELDSEKMKILNKEKETLSLPFVRKYFDKEMMSVVDFFIDSDCEEFAKYCQEIKFRNVGDKDLIINDYNDNKVTLMQEAKFKDFEACYYLIHPLNGRVKAQRWSVENGAISDFITDSIEETLDRIGTEGIVLIPHSEREELQEKFLESEAVAQKNRANYESSFNF